MKWAYLFLTLFTPVAIYADLKLGLSDLELAGDTVLAAGWFLLFLSRALHGDISQQRSVIQTSGSEISVRTTHT